MDAKEIAERIGCVNSESFMGFSKDTLFLRGKKGNTYYYTHVPEHLGSFMLMPKRSWWRKLLGLGPKTKNFRIYERSDFNALLKGDSESVHCVTLEKGVVRWLKERSKP